MAARKKAAKKTTRRKAARSAAHRYRQSNKLYVRRNRRGTSFKEVQP